MLPSGSVHRWCELSERSPVDQAVAGTRRDRDGDTLRQFGNRKGSGFGKPCTSCLEVQSLFTPAARISDDRIQLFRTQYSVEAGRCQHFESGVWLGAEAGTRPVHGS